MSLPKIIAPFYPLTLPSSGKKINYRPFMVKEEKILLIALQAEDSTQMVSALKQIISNCTNGTVDPETTPLFDIEFLFINIRAKSVGEIVELEVKCSSCEKETAIAINIADIKVESPKKDATKIQLTDEIGLVMKYPTLDLIDSVENVTDESDIESKYETITQCIDYIYDAESVHYTKDQTKEELAEFIDSLSKEHMTKIQEFFDRIPQVKENIKFTCRHCSTVNEFEIKGFESLFI